MTREQLAAIVPYATPVRIDLYLTWLNNYMLQYDITGRLREAAFIANVAHESGSFKYVREIASGAAYEWRKDLGNTQKGDGVRFRGRGLIQLSGRFNYAAISKVIGHDFLKNPEMLELPQYATWSACWFWDSKGLNKLADAGQFRAVCRRINGGYNGIVERTEIYNKGLEILT